MLSFIIVVVSIAFFCGTLDHVSNKGEVDGVAVFLCAAYVFVLGIVSVILEINCLTIDNYDHALAVQDVVEDYQVVKLNGKVIEVTLTDEQGNSYTLKGEKGED